MSVSDSTPVRSLELVDAILSRASAITLKAPGPSEEDLHLILKAGTRAPDHGKVQPWRFIIFEGDGRDRLGDIMVESQKLRDPNTTEVDLKRERDKVFRAPTIVAIVCKIQPGKIHPAEQVAAVAAATQNVILAAHALGYGTMWKTGAPAFDDHVKRSLGFEPSDEIVGFVYLGTPDAMPKAYRETKFDEVISRG
jgi:nitroreductase